MMINPVRQLIIKDIVTHKVSKDKLSISVKKNTFIDKSIFGKRILNGEEYKAIELKNISGFKIL